MRKIKVLVLVLLVVLMSGTVYGFNTYNKLKTNLGKMQIQDTVENTATEKPALEQNKLQPFSLLLLGYDKYTKYDHGRSDTIILALVNPDSQKIQLISIPRDLHVPIPGHGLDKINSAYPRGGPPLVKETIEDLFNIDIYGYATINYQGFINLVDVLGGIDINVPRTMRYNDPISHTNINLKKGQQILAGKQALDFVRFRKSNDGHHASDYDRMKRQQQALTALTNKFLSLKTLSKTGEILDTLGDNIKTTLTEKEMKSLIKSFYSFDIKSLETTSLQGVSTYEDNIWYEEIPSEELQRIKDLISEFMQ